VLRVFDYILSRPPFYVIYFFAATICFLYERVEDEENDLINKIVLLSKPELSMSEAETVITMSEKMVKEYPF
jgi:hypothetical protein